MRIAILTDEYPPASRGGSSIVTYREARAFVKRGHEVTVYCSSDGYQREAEGVRVFSVKATYKNAWQTLYQRDALRLAKEDIIRWDPDIAHAHHITHRIGLSFASWCLKRYKTVITIHDATWVVPGKVFPRRGGFAPTPLEALLKYGRAYNPLLAVFSARLLARAHAVVFVSDDIRNYYEHHFGSHSNFHTVHNALELDEWPHQPFRSSEEVTMGFASRPGHDKGWFLFSSLVGALNSTGIPCRGSIISMKESFDLMYAKLPSDLRPLIKFDGYITDDMKLRTWYDSLSCTFVGSLHLDPYPNVAIESLATGRGVIVGPYTGSREIVDDRVGYVLDSREILDPSSFAKQLAKKPPFENWSIHCREIRDRFDMDLHIKRLLELYRG